MVNKTVWSLSFVCFAMSTLLSLVGLISVIQVYFHVSMSAAGFYASIFAGTLGISSIATPTLFSKYEKKKLTVIILTITIFCSLAQFFIKNYDIALIFRIIPAIGYPIIVSNALTIIGKINPHDTNKVVLGISAGSILGLSIVTYLGMVYGFQMAMMWYCIVSLIALILVLLFVPPFEGNKDPIGLQISRAKSKLFILSAVYSILMIIGISITYNYIPTYLKDVTLMQPQTLSAALLIMGLMSLIGTNLSGYSIIKKPNITCLLYPIGFACAIFIIGYFIKYDIYETIGLCIFALFDGSAYTVTQYWITSSVRESPEFANGIFLLLANVGIFTGTMIGGFIIESINIYYIFYGSIIVMLLAIPFVVLRIKKYPSAH